MGTCQITNILEKSEHVTTVVTWQQLRKVLDKFSTGWIFRGQRDHTWTLTTSLERAARGLHLDTAHNVTLRKFARRAHQFSGGQPLTNVIEWLALMQHHGAPTKLLDWTSSPYVAAFFALEDVAEDGAAAIWALNSFWAANAWKDNYKASDPKNSGASLPVDRASKEYWDMVSVANAPGIVTVEPFQMNERLTAQQGLFTMCGQSSKTFVENLLAYDQDEIGRRVYKIVVRGACRMHVLRELKKMNITRANLFPGLDGFASSLRFELESLMHMPGKDELGDAETLTGKPLTL